MAEKCDKADSFKEELSGETKLKVVPKTEDEKRKDEDKARKAKKVRESEVKRARQWLKPEEKLRRQQKKNEEFFGATENWEQMAILMHRMDGVPLKKVDEAAEWLLSYAEEYIRTGRRRADPKADQMDDPITFMNADEGGPAGYEYEEDYVYGED